MLQICLATQQVFTCSIKTIKTLEKKLWNIFKFNNKDTRTTSWTSLYVFFINFALVLLLLTLNFFCLLGVGWPVCNKEFRKDSAFRFFYFYIKFVPFEFEWTIECPIRFWLNNWMSHSILIGQLNVRSNEYIFRDFSETILIFDFWKICYKENSGYSNLNCFILW